MQPVGQDVSPTRARRRRRRAPSIARIAERRVRLGLVIGEIGEKNDIKITQDELRRVLIEQARRFPGQEKAVYEYYEKTPGSAGRAARAASSRTRSSTSSSKRPSRPRRQCRRTCCLSSRGSRRDGRRLATFYVGRPPSALRPGPALPKKNRQPMRTIGARHDCQSETSLRAIRNESHAGPGRHH